MSVASVVVGRSLTLTLYAVLTLGGRNPYKEFPWNKRNIAFLLLRTVSGQVNFALYNYCLTLLPLWLMNIIHKTSPFWQTIMGFCCMNETILPIEIVGMIICFGAFIAITVSSIEQTTDAEIETG